MQSTEAKLPILVRADSSEQSRWVLSVAMLSALSTGAVIGLFGGTAALLALLVVLFMAFAVSDYRTGILIAVVLLPLSATQLLPRSLFGIAGLNPLNVTLLMAAASITFMWLFQRRQIAIPSYPQSLYLYVGALTLGAFHGIFHVSSIPAFYKALDLIDFDSPAGYIRDIFLKPMLILVTAFMLSVAVRNARHPPAYLIPLFFSALILPLFVIVYVALSGASLTMLASSRSREVLSVTGMHANELGLMFNMAFALALFSFSGMRHDLKKWMMGFSISVLSVAITLTFSRGAYLGILSVIAYFLFTQRRFKVIAAGLVLVPVVLAVMPQAVVERATTGAQERSIDTITAGRVDRIWRPLAPEVLSSPVVGHGLSSILWSEASRHGLILRVGHPHSAYLGLLLDFGFLGAIVIFFFFWRMWRFFAALARSSTEPLWRGFFQGAMACILLLLVQGLTDDRFTPTFAQTFLWLSYGMAIGLNARREALARVPEKKSD